LKATAPDDAIPYAEAGVDDANDDAPVDLAGVNVAEAVNANVDIVGNCAMGEINAKRGRIVRDVVDATQQGTVKESNDALRVAVIDNYGMVDVDILNDQLGDEDEVPVGQEGQSGKEGTTAVRGDKADELNLATNYGGFTVGAGADKDRIRC